MKKLKIKIKYFADIDPVQIIPNGDWVDLRTADEIHMSAGDFQLISLGVGMVLPDGYEARIAPRSSTFKKYGILMANSIGVVDNSYSGDQDIWKFAAYATRDTVIPKNERICQFRLVEKQPQVVFETVDHLNDVSRGGFGSTDKK